MPFDATLKRLSFARSKPAALGFAVAAAYFFLAASGALAQQPVIIGGGPAFQPVSGAVAPNTVGSGAGGVVVNNSVLDSLGPSPTAGLPVAAPQTPVYGAAIATPGASGSYATQGVTRAYRAPGTGQLMVTRPSTLLYPPMQPPTSRLAVAPKRSAAAAKPAQAGRAATGALPGGKLTSRLIAAPPKKRLTTVAAPKVPKAAPKAAAKAPKMAKPPASKPAKTASVPAKPSAPAAAPSVAPALPKVLAPSAPPAAPKAPSTAAPSAPAPAVAAPKVAAPAIPKTPTAKPAETTVAAIPPAQSQAAVGPGGDLRLTFSSGSAELSGDAKKLLSDLAQNLAQKSSKRVQLLAFAADSGGGASRARRLSLSRALAVRAFLIDKGVRSTRMDVRALGNKAGDGPADRVDILPR